MKKKIKNFISKIFISYSNINHRLFWSLIFIGFIPTIYTTLRVFYLGSLPNSWSFSIAGQLTWINLIYEIINEAVLLPLFYFLGKSLANKKEFINKIKTGLLVSFLLYTLITILILIFAKQLLNLMAVNKEIIDVSKTYIRIESVANIFTILASFTFIVLISVNKSKYIYILTFVKLFLIAFFDLFLVSTLKISLNLGVNGIGITNIIVNIILFSFTVFLLYKSGFNILNRDKLDFLWMKEFIRKGIVSGLESFIRNIFYILMISRLINVVKAQGTYWVTNNFIWGFLLLPVLQLAELIKQETSSNIKNVKNNTVGYFMITSIIVILWFIFIPLYKPFLNLIVGKDNVLDVFNLLILLIGFYVLFSFQNIFDATFYGLGKINYMLFESIVTNTIYYTIFFILYKQGKWIPSLEGIALMFGGGIAFDSVVSMLAYIYLLKKHKINILDIQRN